MRRILHEPATNTSEGFMARGKKTEKTIPDAIREICRSLPETEERPGHEMPVFGIVNGKHFATLAINHHGDGILGLWLKMPAGAQALYVGAEPEKFYVPPLCWCLRLAWHRPG